MNICFIGFGNLAKAIAKGLKQNNQLKLFATSPTLIPENKNEISTHFDNKAFIAKAQIIILAVKPVQVTQVLTEIGTLLPKKSVLISVAAGISLDYLAAYCPPKQAIVRCMPNTPIAVSKGASAFIANGFVSENQKETIERLFNSLSITAWLKTEDEINMITALSGSGPAYVFLFMEALMNASQKLGLPPALAQSFTKQTVAGALDLLEDSGLPLSKLRENVTSKGGTTAAALTLLEKHHFSDLIFQAVNAAYERAKALEKNSS